MFALVSQRAAALFLISVSSLAGCVGTAPALRLDLPVTRLMPAAEPPPQTGQSITFTATPVQIASFEGTQHDSNGNVLPVSVRVPQEGTPTTHSVVSPSEMPNLVGTDIYPHFNVRTIPLLPYGAFWVEIGNASDQPITIDPKQIHLTAGGREVKPLGDAGAQEGRYSRIIQDVGGEAHRAGRPVVGFQVKDRHLALSRLYKPATIPAHGTFGGYVAFDVNSFNADEYNMFLQKAGTLKLELRDGNTTLASASFAATQQPVSTICLPGTKQPTFADCEVVVTEASAAPPAVVPATTPN